MWLIGLLWMGALFNVMSDATNEADILAFWGITLGFIILYLIKIVFQEICGYVDKYKENKIVEDKKLDKLEKLSILRWQGALTDSEFNEMKEKILKK